MACKRLMPLMLKANLSKNRERACCRWPAQCLAPRSLRSLTAETKAGSAAVILRRLLTKLA